MKTFNKLALAVAVSSGLIVTGCGGGGSSTAPDNSTSTSSVVSGSAVKGVMKNAIVTAYELDDAGDQLKPSVGSTTTDNQGEYRVELGDNYGGGIIEIEITTNSETRMVCDASKCGTVDKGDEVALPTDFKLNAIGKASASGSSVSVPVTAWSTMAAKRAKALLAKALVDGESKTVADAAKQAKAEVSQVAGFDIENTAARGISNLEGASASEKQAAVMNAAVAELVFASNSAEGEDEATKLDSFSDALNDGKIDSSADDSFSPASLSAAVKGVVESSTADLDDETKESLNNQTAQLDAAGDSLDTSYDENLNIDDTASQPEKIAAFKSFVSEFRTWASSINDTAVALEDETSPISEALDVDVETVKNVFTQAGVSGELVSRVLGVFFDQLSGTKGRAALVNALDNGDTFTANQEWTDEEDTTVKGSMDATLVFEATASGLKATASGQVSQIEGQSRDFELTISTSLSRSDLDLTYDAEKVRSLLVDNNINVSGTISEVGGAERAVMDLVASLGLSEDISSGSVGISGDEVEEKFNSLSLNGSIALTDPEAASFDGEVSVSVVKMTNTRLSGLDEPFSPSAFSLSGDFTAASGRTFNISTSLNSSSAQRFNLFTYLDYNDTTDAFDFDVEREKVLEFVEYDDSVQSYSFYIVSNAECDVDGSGNMLVGERVAFSTWFNSELGFNDGNCNILDSAENAALDELITNQLVSAVGETVAAESGIEQVWVYGDSDSALASVDADIAFPSLETADDFVNLSVNIAAGVSLVDLPKATAVVTLSRSTLNGASALTNVSWDGGSYKLKVSTAELNVENPEVKLEFWNPQGFRLEAVGSETADGVQSLTGNAFINGEDIGDVELRNGVPVITYPNDEETMFETLF